MRTFLYCEAGFVEKDQWLPNSWVNVECPTPEDIHYLTNQFNVPESFLSDIADTDERPRIEYEGNWLLTIIRIPVQSQEQGIPFTTIPLGIMTNNEIIISVCYYKTELIPDSASDPFVRRMVPEIPETNQQRGGACRKGAGKKYP